MMFVLIFGTMIFVSISSIQVEAQSVVPEWIRNAALWYGQGKTTDADFINAIKYLIENKIIIIEDGDDKKDDVSKVVQQQAASKTMTIVIPNGNSLAQNSGFYIPLNAVVKVGTLVIWVNDDVVGHTVQSQDEFGNVIGLFNSDLLTTGQRFAYTFDEEGIYNYFCTIHPWRVGTVTVV
jgi:plastocyanin